MPTDPHRPRIEGCATFVWFAGMMNVLFGVLKIAVDRHAGMPPLWTWWEGPPIIAFALIVLVLSLGDAPRERS